jgi:hypothetical protein
MTMFLAKRQSFSLVLAVSLPTILKSWLYYQQRPNPYHSHHRTAGYNRFEGR